MRYYPFNVRQCSRNITKGVVPSSVQYRALALLANVASNAVLITKLDAAQCGFAVTGPVAFVAKAAAYEHNQFHVSGLVLVASNANTSRVLKWKGAEFSPDDISRAVGRSNKRRIAAIAKAAGNWGEVLGGFCPDWESVQRVAAVHEAGGEALADFAKAARAFRVNRWPSI